jgi:hypothetical protein
VYAFVPVDTMKNQGHRKREETMGWQIHMVERVAMMYQHQTFQVTRRKCDMLLQMMRSRLMASLENHKSPLLDVLSSFCSSPNGKKYA